MRRAYKFRVYPTSGQASRMALCLRDHQRMYNAALEERREAWEAGGRSASGTGSNPPSSATSAPSTRTRAAGRFPASRPPCAVSIRRWPRSTAAAKQDRRPATRGSKPSTGGIRWSGPRTATAAGGSPGYRRVHLQGVGHIKVYAHRAVEGRVKTISLKREGRRWYVVLSCEDVPARPLQATGRQVGVDVGVARFATTSDGEIIPNPKFLRTCARNWLPRSRYLPGRNAGPRTVAERRRRSAKCTAVSVTAAATSTTCCVVARPSVRHGCPGEPEHGRDD